MSLLLVCLSIVLLIGAACSWFCDRKEGGKDGFDGGGGYDMAAASAVARLGTTMDGRQIERGNGDDALPVYVYTREKYDGKRLFEGICDVWLQLLGRCENSRGSGRNLFVTDGGKVLPGKRPRCL